MFNFLPVEYKKEATREYFLRLLTISFVLFSIVAVASIVLIMPSYLAAENRYAQALSEETVAANAVEAGRQGGASAAVGKVSAYMDAALALAPLSPDTIIEPVVSARPAGVTITSISIGRTDSGIEASFAGNAATRDELLTFVKSLEGIAQFGNVDLPVSYLALDSNIDYSITVSVRPLPPKK
jgi:hypothetical protein